mmetsp:Transcript_11383/g.25094  ORF Transcript_11383/g.25094 Transcript_11383/m.25094 type:complete len:196 (-) Transcript_11383:328-915(-)|eukprot:CAMPEP_0206544854 /NCGR_PEP_ID=MMETSP0325_2-20121206/11792_1 /ASSEMBLY_ACC=CAM_ASM_000347 /TAXON_ID=2866 /ORGANISM="Crypthecodinium cohnii, Strain Seligo" /LENGTH=195 /DNA_ID=CAMNT_0054043735 /DNA_START=77 /DNA_END=664 /DNA_ORIENTATION=+
MGGVCARRKEKEDPAIKKNPYEGLTLDQQVHAAACNCDTAYIERLGEEGKADLNCRREPDACVALDSVAWCGATDCALALLKYGADPSLTTHAIVGAASTGEPKMLEAMLKAGGPANQEMSDCSALRWAAEANQEECVILLLEHGAWKAEEDQDTVLRKFKRRRMKNALAKLAEMYPILAEDCVCPAWYAQCPLL